MSTVKPEVEERVLVVPRVKFDAIGAFQGFSPDYMKYKDLVEDENVEFIKRKYAECDPEFKQIIPYLILHGHNETGETCIFTYSRNKSGGEDRLHSKLSIGTGGHINPCDASGPAEKCFSNGMLRELTEELDVQCGYEMTCAGLINDDSNDVGKVHLGIVYLVKVADITKVTAKSEDLADAKFMPYLELQSHRDRMETWSQICYDNVAIP